MKTFLILFRTGSIPFSSNKKDIYLKEWLNYINKLNVSKKLIDYSFLKKDVIILSGERVENKSYIPHKDIFSGFLIVKANNSKEVIEITKSCPVFKRNGDIQIKEIEKDYLNHK